MSAEDRSYARYQQHRERRVAEEAAAKQRAAVERQELRAAIKKDVLAELTREAPDHDADDLGDHAAEE